MAAELNLIDVKALGQAKSIDMATKIEKELNGLFEILRVTSKLPMNIGTGIQTFAYNIIESEKPDGDVIEGDIIPLTKVERKVVATDLLTFTKFRKSTSIEAIQAHGYDVAIQDTDAVVLDYVQEKFRAKFFTAIQNALTNELRTNTDALSADTLQGALAFGRANLKTLPGVTANNIIAFVNPQDAAKHLSDGVINSPSAQFGMTLLTNYVGVQVIELPEVPAGKVWMTTSQNIKVAYANPRGEVSRAFPFVTDETGYVGILHDIQAERLTADTVYASAVTMYPENIDQVVEVTIGGATAEPTV